MKKEYVKPYLAVESFQLDASIASGCQRNLNQAMDSCSFLQAAQANVYIDIYFGPACSRDGGIDIKQENPDICYHGPVSTLGLMGS